MLDWRCGCVVAAAFALGACAPVEMGLDAGGGDVGPRDAAPSVDANVPNLDVGTDTGGSCATPDVDGDGHATVACGGDDCDDADPARFPTNPELCDASGHDEDCDPSTFGTKDLDLDGYVSSACCNTDSAGAAHCGDDCDDTRPGAHPIAPEVCDGLDDDCDVAIDEGVLVTVYPDLDHDGYGTGAGVSGCAGATDTAPLGGDCDDTHPSARPGGVEICDALDDDCDGAFDEEPLASASCSSPHGTSVCAGGTCTLSGCDVGYHVCSGVCVTSSAVATCGTSCTPCVQPPNAISTSCDGTSCSFTCASGFGVSGGACDVLVPRPIAPLSTATVSSRRPTLHWSLAAGTDGARVELCRDRACTSIITTIDATGSTGAPAVDLPTGVVFWRVHGRIGAVTGTNAGPTWQFVVGARTAPVDASWGTTLDVNGDGHPDLAVGADGVLSGTGRAYLYLGTASGIASAAMPSATLTGPDGASGYFGRSVASAGDVNGDGYGDLVVGAYNVASGTGRAYLYLGGASGIATSAVPTTTLIGPGGAGGLFGFVVASAGDVNGDGYADVAISADGVSSFIGAAYIYLGGPSGIATSPTATLAGPGVANDAFGWSLVGACDFNGDGYGDVAIGAYGVSTSTGRVYVFLGSASGIAASVAPPLTGPDGTNGYYGSSLACASDLNGDGYSDLAVGAPNVLSNTGRVYVYHGGATGPSSAPTTTTTGPDGTGAHFGDSLGSAGDVNGDGYGDLAVGAWSAAAGVGMAHVYVGSASGVASSASTSLTGADGLNGRFGWSVGSPGDLNGDGYAELCVGAWGAVSQTGRAYTFAGGAVGIANTATPTATLTGPDGANGLFGRTVTSAEDVLGAPLWCCSGRG